MNPGIYDLGDITIGAAMTDEVITEGTSSVGAFEQFLADFDGLSGVTLQCHFSYAGGGTAVKVDIETSLDQGMTWFAIARFVFSNATLVKVANLTASSPVTTIYEPVTLADNTVVDGILGDRLRAKVTSTGTYTGATTLSVRAHVR